jgi:1-acyl-sn-glycerol-3-phosphate acyltransferase
MWKPTRIALAILSIPVLCGSLIACNALQMLTLLVRPLSGKAFRAANCLMARAWFNLLSFTLQKVLRVRFVLTGDNLPARENAFVVANHQSQADIPALVSAASRYGRAGDLKWFVKYPLKWVPGVGWGMQFLDCIFVKRNWSADKDKILATFARLREHRIPFWVLSFVEGTRMTPAKLARSQEYQQKAGLPVLRYVMSPRTRGFEATLEGLGTMTDAVYDFTIAFEGYRPGCVPGLGALFFGPVDEVHVHVDRFPLAAIPASREGRVQWITDRFAAKDERLRLFQRKGSLV